MKKAIILFVVPIVVFIIVAAGYYFMPKTFGKNVNPSEVDHINVFDGNTGTAFTITAPEDIESIVKNIQSKFMKKDGLSLGRMGYGFEIRYLDNKDKDIIPEFILNSDNAIQKAPFFYVCTGGLCFDYIEECEKKYKTNETGSTEIDNGEESGNTEAFSIESTGNHGTIKLSIPETWKYDVIEKKKDSGAIDYGFHIYPDGNKDHFVEVGYADAFGTCGTGLEQKKMKLAGMDVAVDYFDGKKTWDCVIFPDKIVAVSNMEEEIWATYADEFLNVLDSLEFGNK